MKTTMVPPGRLASPLQVLTLVFGALGGCLLPQDNTLLTDLPSYNNPPRILENQVQPPYRILRGYGVTPSCSLDFSVIVEDLDLDDILFANWYVDFDPNVPRGADRIYRLAPNKAPNKTVRDERATLSVRYNSTDLYRLNFPGDHVVELIVSDRPLSESGVPQPDQRQLADGTTVFVPNYSASYVWFVRTEAGATCP